MSTSGRRPADARPGYDVAIVGTGPGGGMAACRLAARGIDVLVLEKERLPRAKACGGAMPGDIRALFDWSIEHLVSASAGVQLYRYDHSERSRLTTMDDPMILVDRSSFDRHFVDRAVGLGKGRVELREGAEVRTAVEDADGVTLSIRGGETVRCRYVIAADGATSAVARGAGLYTRAGGAAVDAAVRVVPEVFAVERERVTFNVHCVEAGYGWIFPKRDHLSCGVGMWRRPRHLLRELEEFLARALPATAIVGVERLSHPVPVFQGHRPVATRRICLVGDAAHMVDPVLGEGIKYAVQAGRLAADVVTALCRPDAAEGIARDLDTGPGQSLAALMRAHADCRVYDRIVRCTIARQLNLIRLQQDGFFTDPDGVYQSLVA